MGQLETVTVVLPEVLPARFTSQELHDIRRRARKVEIVLYQRGATAASGRAKLTELVFEIKRMNAIV